MTTARWVAFPLGALALWSAQPQAAAVSFSAGPAQTALIELYTSEGCSSCPPAEDWLSNLRQDDGLWRDFVPVAFHVDYWDRLGWKDPYSSQVFTSRQYALASAWGSNSVYTPCFVRNGLEWRPGIDQGPGRSVGILTLSQIVPGRWRVEFEPTDTPRKLEGHVALLAGGIVTTVRAGENAGRKLAHEFVAFALRDAVLAQAGPGRFAAEIDLPTAAPAGASRLAIAAWVTPAYSLKPLQAVGGWIN